MFSKISLFFNSAVEEKPIEVKDCARRYGGKFHTKVRSNPKVQKQAMLVTKHQVPMSSQI